MPYELDISSESSKVSSDLSNDQALIILNATTNRGKIIAKDSAGDEINIFLRPSKRYVATLTQTAGNAPVATVLENDLSAAIVFARTSAGLYTGTLIDAFSVGKTMVRFGTPIPVDDLATIEVVLTSANVITFKTKNYKTSDDSAGVLDGLLTDTAIVIEVFP